MQRLRRRPFEICNVSSVDPLFACVLDVSLAALFLLLHRRQLPIASPRPPLSTLGRKRSSESACVLLFLFALAVDMSKAAVSFLSCLAFRVPAFGWRQGSSDALFDFSSAPQCTQAKIRFLRDVCRYLTCDAIDREEAKKKRGNGKSDSLSSLSLLGSLPLLFLSFALTAFWHILWLALNGVLYESACASVFSRWAALSLLEPVCTRAKFSSSFWSRGSFALSSFASSLTRAPCSAHVAFMRKR